MTARIVYISLILAILFTSCVPENVTYSDEINVDLSNSEYLRIMDLQDRQEIDSLYQFFSKEDPTQRYLAVQAMASIKNPASLDSLSTMLYDANLFVRAAAAYAMGQIGEPKSATFLINAFKPQDTFDVNNIFNANILEAIGKVGDANFLRAMSTVKSYRTTDTLLLEGQTRGIYRYALRQITDAAGTALMIEHLNNPTSPESVRLMAANYLFRAKDIDLKPYKFQLVEHLSDKDPLIRMTVATAMGKTADIELLPYLFNRLNIESDYRVKVNIVKSFRYFPYIQVVDKVLSLINDPDERIAIEASDYLFRYGNPNDALIYRGFITDSLSANVKAKMYRAVLSTLPHYYTNTRNLIAQEILDSIENEPDPYIKSDYINALGFNPRSYSDLATLAEAAEKPIVRTSCVEALGNIISDEKFVRTFKYQTNNTLREIAGIFRQQIETGDVGVMAMAGSIISNPECQLKEIIDSTDYLIQARNNLKLPEQIETFNEIDKAICFLQGREYSPRKLEYNNPIDWSKLNGLTDSSLVVIKTSQGNISLKMLTREAPGSVANFLKLVDSDFYDGNIVHRVVPNFVVQAGCPRGDGYGGLNYTIRSELPQMYYDQEGLVGMASAGNHTEGTQWFITHTATPHLDGNYTIFAKVIEGMDVVHKLERGDKIIDVIKI